jgi:hypothetical protein
LRSAAEGAEEQLANCTQFVIVFVDSHPIEYLRLNFTKCSHQSRRKRSVSFFYTSSVLSEILVRVLLTETLYFDTDFTNKLSLRLNALGDKVAADEQQPTTSSAGPAGRATHSSVQSVTVPSWLPPGHVRLGPIPVTGWHVPCVQTEPLVKTEPLVQTEPLDLTVAQDLSIDRVS